MESIDADKGRFPSDLRMYHCGYSGAEGNTGYGPAIRTNWIIHFVSEGEGDYQLNGKTYHVEAGSIFLVSPGDRTFYAASPLYPWSYYWFTFNGRMCEFVVAYLGLSRQKPVAKIKDPASLEHAYQALIQAKQGSDFFILEKLYSLLHILDQQIDRPTSGSASYSKHYVSRAITLIENNYLQNITASMIARDLNLERTYFSKLFKAQTGISPQRYITRYKVYVAAKLLETTNASIYEIAHSVGFSSLTYFYRSFKRFKLTTPDQYRKLYQ